jgi:hypothetical protein
VIVYHGSNVEVMRIDLSKSSKGLDFGSGFYVTVIREQAEDWADKKSKKYGGEAIVSEFSFNYDNAFKSSYYDTKRFEKYNEEWLDFIVDNRNNTADYNKHNYDIIEGPLADDEVVAIVKSFLDSGGANPTREQLLKELQFREVTHQICFCTIKSLDSIERVDLRKLPKVEKISSEVVNYLVKKDEYSVIDAVRIYHNSDIYSKLSREKSALHYKFGIDVYLMLKDELAKKQLPSNQKDGNNLELSL